MKNKILKDFFGQEIEVGDDYFYGHPTQDGIVVEVKKSCIVIEYPIIPFYRDSKTTMERMTCRSPERGVCLNKIKYVQ